MTLWNIISVGVAVVLGIVLWRLRRHMRQMTEDADGLVGVMEHDEEDPDSEGVVVTTLDEAPDAGGTTVSDASSGEASDEG